MKPKGVVYVLTNPSFPEYVKIGYADDLEKRLKDLNRSECLPYAFRAYCKYEVEGRLKDKDIHGLLDKLDPDLRSIDTFDGKPRVREFFNMTAEDAYDILKKIASFTHTTHCLKMVTPEGHEIDDEKLAADIQDSGKVSYTEEDHLLKGTSHVQQLYQQLKTSILALSPLAIEPKKMYIAFKGSTNVCDIVIQRSKLKVFVNVSKGGLNDPKGIAEDITDKGHWGNGDYSFNLSDADSIDYAIELIKQSLAKNGKSIKKRQKK